MDSQNSYSVAEAKNQLPALIHQAEKTGPVRLTRRGKPVAVLLSQKEYSQLTDPPGAWFDKIMALRQSGQIGSEDCGDDEFEGLRDRSPGRPVDL
jgi:prevent-host-death family protein